MAKEIALDPQKETVFEALKTNKSQLQKEFGVIRIGVFGKVPKSEVIKNEDINILVEVNQIRFDLRAKLKSFIEDIVGDQVNLITNGSARSHNLDITNKKVRRLVAFV